MNHWNRLVLIAAMAIFSLLWVGCDIFTTQTVFPAPETVESISELFPSQKPLEYKMVESWKDGNGVVLLLPEKKSVFRKQKDSLIGGIKWTSIVFSLVSLNADTLFKEMIWLRSGPLGTWLTLDSSIGAKFFSLKRSANILDTTLLQQTLMIENTGCLKHTK